MDSIIAFVTENKEIVGTFITIILILLRKNKKIDKALGASAAFNHILVDSIEKSSEGDMTSLIKDEVCRRVGTAGGAIQAVSDVVVGRVDPKPAKEVPAVKRFWRRLLAGENIAGKIIQGTVASQVNKHLNK